MTRYDDLYHRAGIARARQQRQSSALTTLVWLLTAALLTITLIVAAVQLVYGIHIPSFLESVRAYNAATPQPAHDFAQPAYTMPSTSQDGPGATEAQPAPQSTPLPTALVWTIPADGVLVQPDGSVVGAKPDEAPPGAAVPAVIDVQAAPEPVKLPSVGKAEPTVVKLPRGGKETRP